MKLHPARQVQRVHVRKGLLKVWLSSSCGDWSSLEG
jgi:hypothetical protein